MGFSFSARPLLSSATGAGDVEIGVVGALREHPVIALGVTAMPAFRCVPEYL
jgi:hypothetical protein